MPTTDASNLQSLNLFSRSGKTQRFIGDVLLSKMSLSPWNPRLTRDEARVKELAEAIRQASYDVTRAVKVHRDASGKLLVFAGGTRMLAAAEVGLTKIPAFEFIGYDDTELWRLAYADNTADGMHSDLPKPDVWADYARRYAAGMTQQQIADALGVSQATVSKRIKWNGLPASVKKEVFAGMLDEHHLEEATSVVFAGEYSAVLAPWLTTEQAQAELLDEVLGKHRGSEAGIKPTVKIVREAAKRWKDMIIAAVGFVEKFEGEDADEWREKFGKRLAQKKARNEAAVESTYGAVLREQQVAAERKKRKAQEEADAATQAELKAREKAERQERIDRYVARIVLGDAREKIAASPSGARLLLTDPPYGKDYQSNRRKGTAKKDEIEGDANLQGAAGLLQAVLTTAYASMAADSTVLVFYDGTFDGATAFRAAIASAGFICKPRDLIWDKNNHGTGDLEGSFAPKHECIIHAVKGKPKLAKRIDDVLTGYKDKQDSEHPTEKPMQLLVDLINAVLPEEEAALRAVGRDFGLYP